MISVEIFCFNWLEFCALKSCVIGHVLTDLVLVRLGSFEIIKYDFFMGANQMEDFILVKIPLNAF
jgi:hypothetical protein